MLERIITPPERLRGKPDAFKCIKGQTVVITTKMPFNFSYKELKLCFLIGSMQITVPWFKIKIDNNFTGDIISLVTPNFNGVFVEKIVKIQRKNYKSISSV